MSAPDELDPGSLDRGSLDPGSLDPDTAVAVVGMAGRFPDAGSVAQLWQLLTTGGQALRRFSRSELDQAGVPSALAEHPGYVPAGTVMPEVDRFDAGLFGITPTEARVTDPQHRVFLECAWTALEDAAVRPDDEQLRIGVFGGTTMSSYLFHNVLTDPELGAAGPVHHPTMIGNDKDFLCTRVAYRLGLTGPAVTVQTACSTSLVAVHLAVQSLLEDECDVALAGGVSILVPQSSGYLHVPGGPLSADGRCRVFDVDGTGTVKGNGCGLVVLRRLDSALAQGHRVLAVIRGSAVNNDGSAKVGFTAPSVRGQAAAIREALAVSGVPARDIGYVETHGTGTRLGDPIEVRALAEALGPDGPQQCLIGSLKANIGHLDAAAGVTGLIKTVLVLAEQTVPVQVGFRTPNPELKLETTPFEVPTATRPVPLRAAAVSNFGMGGTNAHAVLTPGPRPAPRPPAPPGPYLVLLSAPDGVGLDAVRAAVRGAVAADPALRLDDLAYTLLVGRARLDHREGHLVGDRAGLLAALQGPGAPDPSDDPIDDPLGDPLGDPPGAEVGRRLRAAWQGWLRGERPEPADCGDLSLARRIALPGYPLRRDRHWIDPPPAAGPGRPAAGSVGTGAPEAAEPARPPGGASTAAVLEVLRRRLGLPDLPEDADFFAVGGESLAALEVIADLRDRFGAELDLTDFQANPSASALGRLLSPAAAGPPPGSPVALLRPGPAGQEIFLVHPAGGTSFVYADLVRASRDPSPVYAISFPFADAASLRTIPELADRYLAEIRAIRPHGPYRLGGYSFGGNVALEIAARLVAQGEQVRQVVLFDALPPQAYRDAEVSERAFSAIAPALLSTALGLRSAAGAQDRPPTTLDAVVELIRRPDWAPGTAEQYRRHLGAWLGHIEALQQHQQPSRFAGRVVLLAATDDLPDFFAQLGVRVDRSGWRQHLDRLRVVEVPGDHYSIFRDATRLAVLAAVLDEVLADGTPTPGVPPPAAPAAEISRSGHH